MKRGEADMYEAIGMIELSSIARGYEASDAMLKAASVELILARTICSGKYISLVAGDVAEVESSVEAGARIGAHALIDRMVIPQVHASIFPAVRGMNDTEPSEALGVVESFSVAACLEAADAAAKTSDIELLEIRLAMALGGKAFFSLTGDVADVRAAVDMARDMLARNGVLVDAVVIARPGLEIYREII